MPPPEKTLTQTEVNGLLATARRKHEAELAELQKSIGERDLVLDAARARVLELEGQHAEVIAAHRRERVERDLTSALVAARMAPSASAVAVAELLRNVEGIEQDASGQVVAVQYAGQRYTSATDAAKVFLAAHPFFEAAPMGGSGAARTLSPAPAPTLDLTKADPMALASEGWSTPAK